MANTDVAGRETERERCQAEHERLLMSSGSKGDQGVVPYMASAVVWNALAQGSGVLVTGIHGDCSPSKND